MAFSRGSNVLSFSGLRTRPSIRSARDAASNGRNHIPTSLQITLGLRTPNTTIDLGAGAYIPASPCHASLTNWPHRRVFLKGGLLMGLTMSDVGEHVMFSERWWGH